MGGRRIQNDAHAAALRPRGDRSHCGHGNFQLQQQRVSGDERRIGNARCIRRGVRSRNDRDGVLAGSVDVYQRHPVGSATCRTQPTSTPAAMSPAQRVTGEEVGTDRAGHGDVGARTTRGQRLVGAFAARQRGEGAAGDRLAGQRQSRDARHEIEIDGAEDDDHPPLTPPCVRPTTISFWMRIVSSSTGSVTMIAAAARGPQASCSNVSTL